jgi:hypothetical protein
VHLGRGGLPVEVGSTLAWRSCAHAGGSHVAVIPVGLPHPWLDWQAFDVWLQTLPSNMRLGIGRAWCLIL